MEVTLQIERELQLQVSHNTIRKHMASASKANSAVSDVANEPLPALLFFHDESSMQ